MSPASVQTGMQVRAATPADVEETVVEMHKEL